MILADVYEAYRMDSAFDHLRTEGIVLVPGEGSSRPNILIVGEAPGAMENTHKRPFVGASGQVLRSLITDAAEIEPQDYFITNVVKYRPPNNRTPSWQEVDASRPYLRQEYSALGSPPIMVAVGATAKEALLPELQGGVLTNAGKPISMGPGRTGWAMLHPSYGLRRREARPLMERHWIEFGKWYRKGIWRA